MPSILNSSYSARSKKLFMEWSVEDEGDLPVSNIIIDIYFVELNTTNTIGMIDFIHSRKTLHHLMLLK